MKRKVLAVLLVLTSVFMLTSCSGKTDAVTDNNGKQYTIARGKKDFAETDDKGKLIIYETDSNGKIKQNADGKSITSVIDFPNYITNGKTVECEYFRIEIPDGWQVQKGHTIKLFNEEALAEVTYTVRSTDSAEECLEQVKDLYSDWDAGWKETEVNFDFATAKVISSSKLIESYEKAYYAFTVDGTSYVVSTSFNTKLAESVDFESVIGKTIFK